jgi:transposase-like protein
VDETAKLAIKDCFCHNSACPDHGKRGRGKVIRMVYCRTCKASSSERKGTALERSQLPPDKAIAVLDHIREGCGIRATSRLTGVARDTISRYIARAGDQAKNLHDELVAFSPSNP